MLVPRRALDLPCALAPNSRSCILARREERLPYSTELSPIYFEELIDVGRKQVAQSSGRRVNRLPSPRAPIPRPRPSSSRSKLYRRRPLPRGLKFGPDDCAEHRRAGRCLRVEHT